FFRDLAILLDDEAARGLVLVEAAEQLGRHAPVGALRAVLVDDVEKHELALGIGAGFLCHRSLSALAAALSKGFAPRFGMAEVPTPFDNYVGAARSVAAPRAS